ncbi:MAG: hypothetical protein GY711_01605 [bacterium]|nr:hypothetical protein [bacterium]
MPEEPKDNAPTVFEGLDDPLREQLPTFEVFFKTFGFKRIHGRVWGLLVLAGQPISSKEVSQDLGISSGAASTTLNELAEWGAINSCFDSTRRCHLHSPVGNTLSIVATVLRRREQVIFSQFKIGATRTLNYVKERYGPKDPRTLTLRSIISSCEIAEAVMQLVFSSVSSALGDSESVLSKAVHTALRIGMVPAKMFSGPVDQDPGSEPVREIPRPLGDEEEEDDDDEAPPSQEQTVEAGIRDRNG